MKGHEDNKPPCLMPRDGWKDAPAMPFHKIETEEEEIHAMIKSIIGVGK